MFQQNASSSSDFTASQGFEQFLNAKGTKEEKKMLEKFMPTSAKVNQSLQTKKMIEKKQYQQMQQMAMQQQYMMGMGGYGDEYDAYDNFEGGYGGAYDVYDQYMMDDPEMMAAATQQGMLLDDAEDEKNVYDFDISEQTEKSNQVDENKKKYLQKKQQLANKRKAQQEKEEEEQRKIKQQQQAEEDRKKKQQEFLAKQQQQQEQQQQKPMQQSIQSSIEGSGNFDISEAQMSKQSSQYQENLSDSDDLEKKKKKMLGIESSEQESSVKEEFNGSYNPDESKPEIYDSSLTDQFKLQSKSLVRQSQEKNFIKDKDKEEEKEKDLKQQQQQQQQQEIQQQQQQNAYDGSMGSDPLTQSEEKELELKRQKNELLDFNKLQQQKKLQLQKEEIERQIKEQEEEDERQKEEAEIRAKLQKLEQDRKKKEIEKEKQLLEQLDNKTKQEEEQKSIEQEYQALQARKLQNQRGYQQVLFQDYNQNDNLDDGSAKALLQESQRRNQLYQQEIDKLMQQIDQYERKIKSIESDYGRKELELNTKLGKAQERVDYFDNVAENRAVMQIKQQMEAEKEDWKFELDKAKNDSEYYRKLSEQWRKELLNLRRVEKGREEKDSIVSQLKRNIIDLQEKLKLATKRTYMSKLFEVQDQEQEEGTEENYCVEIEKELQLQDLIIKGYQKENEKLYANQITLQNELNGLTGQVLDRAQRVNEMKLELAKSKGKFILEGREVDIRELQTLAGEVLLDENEIKKMEKKCIDLQKSCQDKDIRIDELEDQLNKIREKKKEMEQEFVGIGLDRMHAEDREIQKIEQAYTKQIEGFLEEIHNLKEKVAWYVEKWEQLQEQQRKLNQQLEEKNEQQDSKKNSNNEKYFKKRAKELENERNALEEELARRRPEAVKQIRQWRVNAEDWKNCKAKVMELEEQLKEQEKQHQIQINQLLVDHDKKNLEYEKYLQNIQEENVNIQKVQIQSGKSGAKKTNTNNQAKTPQLKNKQKEIDDLKKENAQLKLKLKKLEESFNIEKQNNQKKKQKKASQTPSKNTKAANLFQTQTQTLPKPQQTQEVKQEKNDEPDFFEIYNPFQANNFNSNENNQLTQMPKFNNTFAGNLDELKNENLFQLEKRLQTLEQKQEKIEEDKLQSKNKNFQDIFQLPQNNQTNYDSQKNEQIQNLERKIELLEKKFLLHEQEKQFQLTQQTLQPQKNNFMDSEINMNNSQQDKGIERLEKKLEILEKKYRSRELEINEYIQDMASGQKENAKSGYEQKYKKQCVKLAKVIEEKNKQISEMKKELDYFINQIGMLASH